MKKTITFEFDNDDEREGFISWLLDAAGDQHYWDYCEYHNQYNPVNFELDQAYGKLLNSKDIKIQCKYIEEK